MGIDVNELIKVLPTLIKENDTVKGAVITALSGVMVTHEDIQTLIKLLDKRFEAMQQQLDKRFEAMQQQMDKRFDDADKRFEAMQQQLDKRFEAMQQQLDKRFNAVFKRLDEQALSSLEYFEDFSREVVRKLLADRGIHPKRLRPIEILDLKGEFSRESTRVEFDILLDQPPVVGEVTAKVDDLQKVTKFIRKVEFIDRARGKQHRRLFLTKEIAPNIKDEIERLLSENNVELIIP